MRRLLLLLTTALTLGASTPVIADPTTDTLFLVGAMLAPLMDTTPARPLAPRVLPSRDTDSPSPVAAGAPVEPPPSVLNSPAVQRWSRVVMLGELGLLVLMSMGIMVMIVRHTVRLHRAIANDRAGRRRIALR